MILAVKLVMSAATLCFIIGYGFRRRNNALHRVWMLLGFAFTLGIAVVLVVGVHVYGAGYRPAFWLLDLAGEEGAGAVLIAHRVLATATLLALLTQVGTGLARHPLHRRFYRMAIPLWLLSWVSGMFLFA